MLIHGLLALYSANRDARFYDFAVKLAGLILCRELVGPCTCSDAQPVERDGEFVQAQDDARPGLAVLGEDDQLAPLVTSSGGRQRVVLEDRAQL